MSDAGAYNGRQVIQRLDRIDERLQGVEQAIAKGPKELEGRVRDAESTLVRHDERIRKVASDAEETAKTVGSRRSTVVSLAVTVAGLVIAGLIQAALIGSSRAEVEAGESAAEERGE